MKRLGLIIFTLGLLAAAGGAEARDVIYPGSSARLISDFELSGLRCRELWIARNEIYDRNGFCFKTKAAIIYFGNAGCWTSNPRLSRVERRNVSRIQKWERIKACR